MNGQETQQRETEAATAPNPREETMVTGNSSMGLAVQNEPSGVPVQPAVQEAPLSLTTASVQQLETKKDPTETATAAAPTKLPLQDPHLEVTTKTAAASNTPPAQKDTQKVQDSASDPSIGDAAATNETREKDKVASTTNTTPPIQGEEDAAVASTNSDTHSPSNIDKDTTLSPQEPEARKPPPKQPPKSPDNNTKTASVSSKRPSPWRQPKSVREANYAQAADNLDWSYSPSQQAARKKAVRSQASLRHRKRKILRDVIAVRIPMTATVDLAIAVQRARVKRTRELEDFFPDLKQQQQERKTNEGTAVEESGEDNIADDAEEKRAEEAPKRKKKQQQKAPKHMPQREEYDNMVDYLEAKYAQGVMLDDEEEGDGDEEGQGSVYSETSFLDDRELQLTVAEQVMAQSTATKVELQDDDEFFVNIGNLEVEETELTQDHYDPLKDVKNKSPVKRKRKAPATGTTGTTESKKDASTTSSPKKKAKTTTAASNDKKASGTASSSAAKKETSGSDAKQLQKIVADRCQDKDKLHEKLVEMIKATPSTDLPKRKTKEKMSMACPDGKGPGDVVLFANPHVPGQKLKVKVPKNTKPGEKFRVTVPVKEEVDEEKDYNKLSRDFYNLLDDYARAYDKWCDAEGDYRTAVNDKNFNAHFEKRKKFDSLVSEFPKDLKTPVDKAYLQKIMRRARQSKYKKVKPKSETKQEGDTESKKKSSSDTVTGKAKKEAPQQKTVEVPELSTEFPVIPFSLQDFSLEGAAAE